MAAAGKPPKEKDPVNIVHQNAIHRETIRKEQRTQVLYTDYSVNPYKKLHVLSGKPNSTRDSAEGQEDDQFLATYKKSQQLPTEKFDYPQTEAQEIGWMTTPLIEGPRSDPRLHHPRTHSEITKYMDAFWRQKEQENLQQ